MATTIPYVLRLSKITIEKIKEAARRKEVSFTTMCRLLLNERLDELKIESPATMATTPGAGAHTVHFNSGDALE